MRIRLNIIVLLILNYIPSNAFGDSSGTAAMSPDIATTELESARTEYQNEAERRNLLDTSKGPDIATDRTEVQKLAGEVESLQNQLVVQRTSALAVQSPRKVKFRGGRTLFTYKDDAIYEINCAVERITDIQLSPGESLTSAPVAGDTARWTIAIMKSGSGGKETSHVIVKPLDEDADTNLIIATDRHLYHLILRASDFHQPFVSWNYPEDAKEIAAINERRRQNEEPTLSAERLNFKYEIEGKNYDWKPVRVFDDGLKTFIQMKPEMKVSEAPALFLTNEDDTPILTNYRVKGSFYIVDRLFKEAELKVGTKERVFIRTERKMNLIERLFDF